VDVMELEQILRREKRGRELKLPALVTKRDLRIRNVIYLWLRFTGCPLYFHVK
jgi:hypothetical protein